MQRVEKDTKFTSNAASYEYKAVKVYQHESLIGVYILRVSGDASAVVYIYYEEEHRDVVFASIADHIITLKPMSFITENAELLAYMREKLYFPKMREEKVSFSLPADLTATNQYTLQLGDGDSFA